jgi:hypothetical protein
MLCLFTSCAGHPPNLRYNVIIYFMGAAGKAHEMISNGKKTCIMHQGV